MKALPPARQRRGLRLAAIVLAVVALAVLGLTALFQEPRPPADITVSEPETPPAPGPSVRLSEQDADLLQRAHAVLGIIESPYREELQENYPEGRAARAMDILKTDRRQVLAGLAADLGDLTRRHPDQARAWMYQGMALSILGEKSRAADAFLEASRRDLSLETARIAAVTLLAESGRHAEARRVLDSYVASFGLRPGARETLEATVHLYAGNYALAGPWAGKLARLEPDDSLGHMLSGIALDGQNRTSEADRAWDEAARTGDAAQVRQTRSQWLKRLGR